jgi:hypothetical protein
MQRWSRSVALIRILGLTLLPLPSSAGTDPSGGAWEAGYLPLGESFEVSVPLAANGSRRVSLRYSHGQASLAVEMAGHRQDLVITALVDAADSGPAGNSFPIAVLVDDFNLDGYVDLALPESVGYMGDNQFYDLYAYSAADNRFVPLPIGDGDPVCNPAVDRARGSLVLDCADGPRHLRDEFRFKNSRPHHDRTCIGPIELFWSPDQYGYVFSCSTFDGNGRVADSRIVEDPETDVLATRKVEKSRVALRPKPDEAATTLRYLGSGDVVELLEFQPVMESHIDWIQVAHRSPGRERIVGWMKAP